MDCCAINPDQIPFFIGLLTGFSAFFRSRYNLSLEILALRQRARDPLSSGLSVFKEMNSFTECDLEIERSRLGNSSPSAWQRTHSDHGRQLGSDPGPGRSRSVSRGPIPSGVAV